MAVISPQKLTGTETNAVVYLWETVGSGDTCDPVKIPQYDDATIATFGTFTVSAAIALKGSPEVVNPTKFYSMSSNDAVISLVADSTAKVVVENAIWYKPEITGGDGSTDIDVYLVKM